MFCDMKLKHVFSITVLVSVLFIIHSCDGYTPIDNNPIIKAGIDENCHIVEVTPDIDFEMVTGEEGVEREITLDIDDDGTNDLKFRFYGYYGANLTLYHYDVAPLRPDFYISIAGENFARAYNENEEIKCSDHFSDAYITMISVEKDENIADPKTTKTGNWFNLDKKYLCFKFMIAEIWHIGWMEIGFPDGDNKMVIYRYAYSNVPGLCID